MAQQAGDDVVTVDWSHITPQDSNNNLTTSVINVLINDPLCLPGSFTSPNSGLRVNNANMLGPTLTHFFTDNIALTAIIGMPLGFKLTRYGVIRAPGPAEAFGHVDPDDPFNQPAMRKVRQWSPGIILQWYFRHTQSTFCPFVGVGVVYGFFTNTELNPYFAAAVNRGPGNVLAAGADKPGPTYAEGKSSSSWAPIFNPGASYAINKQRALTVTVLYLPLKIEATTVIKASDGTTLATTKTTPRANPIITFVGAPYKS